MMLLIAGGAIGGLNAALGLHTAVTVIETAVFPTKHPVERGIDLAGVFRGRQHQVRKRHSRRLIGVR
jgi:hypothetical protein